MLGRLLPGKVGMISGLFFGLAFGIGGLGAALFYGRLADRTSIDFVYKYVRLSSCDRSADGLPAEPA